MRSKSLIGFFVNTLVLRSRVNPEESFRELLGQVREVCLGAYAHQDVPFEKLVEELQPERDLSRPPLFQAMFALENASEGVLELPGLRLSRVGGGSGIAKFDLDAGFTEDRQGQLHYTLTYATSLFDRATIERMGQHLQRLLEAIAETVEREAWSSIDPDGVGAGGVAQVGSGGSDRSAVAVRARVV